MAALKKKKSTKIKYNRFKLNQYLSMTFISFALMALLNLVKVFSEELFPLLGGLTLGEANTECDLMKVERRWNYEGGLQNCIDYYSSDHIVFAELLYNITSVSLSTTLLIIFTISGIILMQFSKKGN